MTRAPAEAGLSIRNVAADKNTFHVSRFTLHANLSCYICFFAYFSFPYVQPGVSGVGRTYTSILRPSEQIFKTKVHRWVYIRPGIFYRDFVLARERKHSGSSSFDTFHVGLSRNFCWPLFG